jgi:uncharacterized protein YbjQ (UPF0145 family)
MKRAFVALALVTLLGCASSKLDDPAFRAQVARLRVFETDESLPPGAEVVGTVTGTICKVSEYEFEDLTQSAGFLRMKEKAVRLGANALANVVTEERIDLWRFAERTGSFATACWKEIPCHADAVKLATSP